MSTNYEQLGRYVAKRTFSLEAVEVLQSLKMMMIEEGDSKAVVVLERCVAMQEGLRAMQGRPSEPKYGGMDRRGIPNDPYSD